MADLAAALAQASNQKSTAGGAPTPPKGANLAAALQAAQSAPPVPPPEPPTFAQRLEGDVGSMAGAVGTFGKTALEGLGQYGLGAVRAAESIPGELAAHPMLTQAASFVPGGQIVQMAAAPDVVNTANQMKGITQSQIQQSQDRAAAEGQAHPVAGFLGEFAGQNVPAFIGGAAAEKLGGKLLAPSESKLVDFVRKRLINAGTGALIGAVTPTGEVGQNIQAGGTFGPLAGGVADLTSQFIPPIVSKAAALTSPKIRNLLAGTKLMYFMEGKAPIAGDAGPNLRLSVGQLTGDPEVLAAENAVHQVSQQGQAAALDRVSQNNVALRQHLQNLTDSLLSAEPAQGIQKAAANIRQSLVGLEAADNAHESQLWDDFRQNNPNVGFHAPSLKNAIQTTMQSSVEPEFQKEVAPLMKDVGDRLRAAQGQYGDVVPFSTVKNLRTILMNKIRDTSDANYQRVAGKVANVLHNYVTDPNKLVVEGNLPVSNELMVKRNVMQDFNNARNATSNYWANWGDNGLNDFLGQRGQQGDQEFVQGLGKVGTLLSPQRPDLTDYTLRALSRAPGGTQDAKQWFGYNFLKHANSNQTDAEGNQVINPKKAAEWLSTNMDTAKRIFNDPAQHELLDGLQSFFRRASRASAPNLSREVRDDLLQKLGMKHENYLDKFLLKGYLGNNILARSNAGDVLNAIPHQSYIGVVADALNDPEFAQQLMRNAKSSPTVKLMGFMQKYAPAGLTGTATGMAVRALPPNPPNQVQP